MVITKNKYTRILAIVLAIVLCYVGVNYTKYVSLQKVESLEDKFQMHVPKDWVVEYADPTPTIDVSGAFAYDTNKDNFIFIIVSPMDGVGSDYEKDLAAWQKQFEIVNFRFLTSEIKTVGDVEMATYEASVINGEVPYFQKGFITYKDGFKYMVLGQCKDENKEQMIKVFEKSFKTFKFSE